ncbi:MAG: RnfABCDGE type electron transport complex subunit G [Lachnospiraceae bacterium]|nr:RnfABCDGE type electron transport complex subunit G [Lachnospiraceae bacterium]
MSNKIKRKGDSILRDTLAIFAITLVAGLLLGGVYMLTKEPIEKAVLEAKTASYKIVMPEAGSFDTSEELSAKLKAAKTDGCEFNEIVVAKAEDGSEMGYAVLVTSKEGYGGDIQFSIGVDKEGTITGVEVISMSETAGLGAKCTEDEFKGQFKGIKGNEVKLVKGEAGGENEISAISGATITSTAITKAANEVLRFISGLKG